MEGNVLRFGIVGSGVIGPAHASAIMSLPGAQLVAVVDSDDERARQMAERYGATAYTDLGEMLDHEKLDVVNVCTPSGMHGDHACRVMQSGRHVIVEKPMEISLEAIDRMLAVQETMGVKLAVISQHRFESSSRRLHALVHTGAFGRLVLGSAAIPWWRTQEYYDSGAWRGTKALDGGGVLMNQSIHFIDLLQWLMGPVRSVNAYTATLTHRMEMEDTAVAILHFRNGALGTIAATTSAYPGVTTRIEIFGSGGSAILEDDRIATIHLTRDSEESMADESKGERRSDGGTAGASADPAALTTDAHALQIADMMRAIRENGRPLVDGKEARHPIAIIRAIYQSAEQHREVLVP